MSDGQGVLDFLVGSEWTEAEIAVWRALRGHEGAAHAIKAEALAELVGMNVRNVQRAIHSLIHERGRAIGSSMREPHGYYVAVTHAERVEVAKLHRDRGVAMLTTASKILGIDRREYVRQVQTEIEAA